VMTEMYKYEEFGGQEDGMDLSENIEEEEVLFS